MIKVLRDGIVNNLREDLVTMMNSAISLLMAILSGISLHPFQRDEVEEEI